MIFLKKKNKKNSDPKPAKKKSPWKRNSWLRLNLPNDFSSTIEIPQLQSEKIQTSVFAINTAEFNKGEDISPTTNNKSTTNEHNPIERGDLSCSRNNQLINKQHKSDESNKDSLQQDDQGQAPPEHSTPETVCDELGVTLSGEEQDCRKAKSKPVYCEKAMETEVVSSSHDDVNNTDAFSSSSSTSVSIPDSVESSLKTELPLKKEPILEEKSLLQGEDQQYQLSAEEKAHPVAVLLPSLKTEVEPESATDYNYLKEEEASHKEESKVMKRKSAQSFIPRSCKQQLGGTGSNIDEEPSPSPNRRSSSSHLPVFVVKNSAPIDNSSSSSSCSTHSEDSVEKKVAQFSKIPTVVPAKNVKSNSPKTHTSRLPKKRNT